MKERLPYLLAASAVATALHLLTPLPWVWSALAAFVGWPLIGTLVTADDDLPGGFSNPDGSIRPDWLTARYWAEILLGVAIAAAVGAAEMGFFSRPGLALAGSSVVAFVLFLTFRAPTASSD